MKELSADLTVSHYRIVRKLGAGGMGEVYLAQDTKLDRKVALKILPADLASNPVHIDRFVREAKAAAALSHPNIAQVFEIGEHEATPFIAMQFLEGQTLDVRVKSKPLTLPESLNVAAEIADALAEAHSHGIIHRDIKPSNIMISPSGQAKVMDFGLARMTAGVAESEADTQSLLTTPGTILGTIPYMSPEQVKGETVDPRTDIFSFGVVLYEMLIGRHPFASQTPAETISAILSQEPESLSRYAPGLPDELARITAKCLEKDRKLRYQNASEVRVDLQRLKRDTESVPAAITVKPESRTEADAPPTGDKAVSRIKLLLKQRFGSRQVGVTAGGTANVPGRSTVAAFTPRSLIVPAALVVLAFVGAIYFYYPRRQTERPGKIKSLAVLPLKSLDAGDNYLGLGIADAAIRKISQTGKVIVRPTSAVRKYSKEDTDALAAARELGVDSVLEGSFQRAGDQLRVSVNLLRTSDGTSLWSEKYDLRMTDIFTIQDAVAQQVASNLRLQLDASQQAQLAKRYTSNAIAYELYLKGLYGLDQRISASKASMETTIGFFEQAVQADPNFALAHAQLAYGYATMSTFLDPELTWADRARNEINRAQQLDPQLAETHLASSQLLFSAAEGYRVESAIREVLSAQQLNPNIGHGELGFLFFHIGLEDATARELRRALEIDPTSEFVKDLTLSTYQIGCKYDEYFADRKELYPANPPVISAAWYFMGKGQVDEAEKTLDDWTAGRSGAIQLPHKRALLSALKGDFRTAEAAVPSILQLHPTKDPLYHHATYDIACIYALEGKSAEAVKWLREGAANGFPPYPLFECDSNLNRIRQSPEFIQFMAEMKALNDKYQREFGGA